MTTSQDDFSPMSIDQSIDRPDELLSRDDAQLIHDMRAMFEQEKQASIERGWTRIASQRAQNASSDQPLDLSLYRQRNERISLVQDNTLLSSPKKDTPKKRSGLRWLGLVAAVLVCVTLVGSLAVVLGATRGQKPNTQVGGHNAAQQPTPTPTPNTMPTACKDALDPAEQSLCAAGQETTLNLPLTVGGQNITFVRAYADQQRVIFIYSSARPLNQSIIWHRLTTGQGSLQATPSAVRHINTTLYELVFLPDSPQALTKSSLQVQSIQVIGPSVSPTPMALQFTLPIHLGQRVVPLNQTQISNGLTLTLQSVTFTACTTSLVIEIKPSLASFETSGPLSFTLNGQSFTWPMYQENLGASNGTSTVNGMPGVPNTTNEMVLLDQANALTAGADTIQIQVGVSNTEAMTPSTAPLTTHTWTFQVNIPA